MRRIVVPLAVVLLVLAASWLALGGGATRPREPGGGSVVRANSRIGEGERAPDARGERGEAAAERRAAGRAEREVLRRRILAALEGRGAEGGAGAEAAPAEAGRGEAEAAPAEAGRGAAGRKAGGESEAAPAGALVDRTGERGYLMRVMNEELLPLAGECEALARVTRPELAGMLVLEFEILADEDLGGVVEAVVPGQGNEVDEPTLLECMRESILAVTLPPPPRGGRDALSLSMPLAPPR